MVSISISNILETLFGFRIPDQYTTGHLIGAMMASAPIAIFSLLIILGGIYFIAFYFSAARPEKMLNKLVFPNTIFLADLNYYIKSTGPIFTSSSINNTNFSDPYIVCELIEKIPKNEMIHVVINVKYGKVRDCELILRKLQAHPAGYCVYVNKRCRGVGTIIALGAKEIIMQNDSSAIGSIDSNIRGGENKSAMYLTRIKESFRGPTNAYEIVEAESEVNYLVELMGLIKLKERDLVMNTMVKGNMPFTKVFLFDNCQKLGLNVRLAKEQEFRYFDYC